MAARSNAMSVFQSNVLHFRTLRVSFWSRVLMHIQQRLLIQDADLHELWTHLLSFTPLLSLERSLLSVICRSSSRLNTVLNWLIGSPQGSVRAALVDLGGACWDADKAQLDTEKDLLEDILNKLVSEVGCSDCQCIPDTMELTAQESDGCKPWSSNNWWLHGLAALVWECVAQEVHFSSCVLEEGFPPETVE